MDGIATNNNQAADVNTVSQSGSEPTAQQEAQTSASTDTCASQSTTEKKDAEPQTKNVEQLRAEFEKEKAAAVEAAVQEAAKKAAMKPDEAEKYEEQKRKESLEKREKEIQIREMKNDTKDILHEKEIPVTFADFLLGEDMEKTKENIAAFKKEFDAAVQVQVEQRLKGTTPKVSSGIIGVDTNNMSAQIDSFL